MANPGALPSEGNPEPKSTPVSHGTSIEAHFDFLAIGVRKVDFAEHKPYSSYFVLLPRELYVTGRSEFLDAWEIL